MVLSGFRTHAHEHRQRGAAWLSDQTCLLSCVQAFGSILNLVPLAESVVKLTAVCMECFREAAYTKRLGLEKEVAPCASVHGVGWAWASECYAHTSSVALSTRWR